MNKIIVVLCAVLAVVNGLQLRNPIKTIEDADWTVTETYDLPRARKWIRIINNHMDRSKDLYAQKTDLISYINKTANDLNQSDKECVKKYRTSMPTIKNINQSMDVCIKQAEDVMPKNAKKCVQLEVMKFHAGFYSTTEECRQKFVIFETNAEEFFSCLYEKVQENDKFLRSGLNKKFQAVLEVEVNKIENAVTQALECVKGVKIGAESKVTAMWKDIENCKYQ